MPPIEMGPLRPIGPFENRLVRLAGTPGEGAPGEGAARGVQARPPLVASDSLDPGAPPIDAERVVEIRRAIDTGTYPVIPVRIADAMIAAGHLLRSAK